MTRWLTATGFSPHTFQQQALDAFLDENCRHIVLDWGRRCGKTRVGGEMGDYVFIQPDTQTWIIGKTYSTGQKILKYMTRTLRKLFTPGQITIQEGAQYSLRPAIKSAWGSEVWLRSLDDPDSLTGDAIHLALVDEAAQCKSQHYQQYVLPILVDHDGTSALLSTPRGYNWFYDEFVKGENKEIGYCSIKAPTTANPHLPLRAIEDMQRGMGPILWRQEGLADFMTFSGQVYSMFDRDKHVVAMRDTDLTGWPVCVAVDPGLNNPTAILWIAHHPDGTDIVFREHIASNMLFPDVYRIIKQFEPKEGYEACVCDIAGKAREQGTGASFIGFMAANGIQFTARASLIYNGKEIVHSRICDMQGHNWLKIADSCPKTRSAIENYHYAQRKEGQAQPEEPEKDGVNDHPMDALRYYMVWRMAPQSQVWRY